MIPPVIRRIKDDACNECSQLTIVILGEGRLEKIGVSSFARCTLLREIVIPHAIRRIEASAFNECSQLAIAILGKGLEEIGVNAFAWCTLLREILIPPADRVIKRSTFYITEPEKVGIKLN